MSTFSRRQQVGGLFLWLLASYATAVVGAVASSDAPSFYQQLQRPDWAPPAWLFGPVWTTLYTLMGISAWLVWRERGFRAARTALTVFLLQLGVNALWSWLFFVWHLGAASFAEILLLGVLILLNVLLFWRVRLLAGMLLLPYLLWVSFAAVLTYTVWQQNPQLLA
jgi:tryptophan-rich sensory protein